MYFPADAGRMNVPVDRNSVEYHSDSCEGRCQLLLPIRGKNDQYISRSVGSPYLLCTWDGCLPHQQPRTLRHSHSPKHHGHWLLEER